MLRWGEVFLRSGESFLRRGKAFLSGVRSIPARSV